MLLGFIQVTHVFLCIELRLELVSRDSSSLQTWTSIGYIHNNPVKAMLVHNPQDYFFSSACDYEGEKGLVNVTMI